MKKIISFIFVLAVIFLIFQFSINLFKNEHNISYLIKSSNKELTVHEEYYKDKKVDYYYLEVTLDKVKFVFDIDNTFNKQKKIIENIKIYEKKDLICISPVYIKNNNDPDIICNIDGEQYSYAIIKDKYDLSKFTKSIENFDNEKYLSDDDISSIDQIKVFKGNMYDNENIIMYNYSYLTKISKKNNPIIHFANYDIYNNELGVLIDKYYVLPKYEKKPEYSKLLIIDIETENIKELEIKEKLSTNLYINGVVGNKLYLFDKSNMVQYEIDPIKRLYRITGNKTVNAQYYDGKWQTRNIYDFVKNELKFEQNYPIKENYIEAFETDKFYYYYNSSNEFYKVYKKNLNKPIYLFKYKNIEEVNVYNEKIYFINNDTLYRYDHTGIKKILVNKELQYNYNNIYSVYFK